MIRNLKALGLALMAILAMGAFIASSASAQSEQGELTSESGGPVTFDISETFTKDKDGNPITLSNSLTAFGSTVHCPGTTYTGHKWNVTPHELIPNGATTVTISPHYAQPCFVSGERQATINTHGCDFVFHVGKTTPAENENGTYGVTADVVCPDATKGITVTIFANTPPTAEGTDLCTVEVTGGALNQGLTGAHVTNTPASGITSDDLDVKGTFHSIHVERTGLCIFTPGGTTETDGTFHLDVTVKGTNADEEDEGITISDTAP